MYLFILISKVIIKMRKITKRKWILLIICIVMAVLIVCNLLTYIVDPFFQYRFKDNQYFIHTRYCAPGLIKTYDYDTIIIGSSMTQNFDMDLFRTELDCSPLHIGVGGMSDEDLVEYVLLSNKIGKADSYYLCIDIAEFRKQSESRTVDYLMRDDLLSHIQYAISYESLFRFIPVDILFTNVAKQGYSLPSSFAYKMGIDRFGYWGHEYSYGEEVVINGRKTGAYRVSEVDTTGLYEKMVDGIDAFFSQLNLRDANYFFFFPPYSSLYWCDAQEEGYFDAYLDAKEYFVEKAAESGAIVYDFQGADLTTNLDNYKDATHYSPEINDWMTNCFSLKENVITPDNCSEYREKIIVNMESIRKEYPAIFE